MNPIFLVAKRDYRQIASTRSFRITLMFLPVIFALSFLAQSLIRPPATAAYVLVDASGAYGAAIDRRVARDYQRDVLDGLSTYVQRWNVGKADPQAVWASPEGYYSDVAVDRFIASGGADAALDKIAPLLPSGAAKFSPPVQPFVKDPVPPGVPVNQGGAAFGAAMAPTLNGNAAKVPLALAIYIPRDFGQPGVAARLWTTGRASGALIDMARDELNGALKRKAFEARGLSPADAASIETMTAPLDVARPPAGSSRGQVIMRSLVPLALAYLLLITAFITGGMMLQGVIEERSNRLLESVLACIRPHQLMAGKLLGLGAIGLTLMAVWIACAVGAATFLKGTVGDFLLPSLTALQPWMIGALLFYFLAGYLIVSMAFLAIGSVSNSIQDAQAYLMPMMIVLMMPVILMMGSMFSNPGGTLPIIMSWIPLYTPFAMLARLGSGVPLGELLGTGALLIVFVVAEFLALGRVFQASLLNTGQPPRLAGFIKLMLRPAQD